MGTGHGRISLFPFRRQPLGGGAAIKAGGVGIVQSYVLWIHHEEEEGIFNFSGNRDLRRFVTLCHKHGLLVWLRLGP